MKRLIGLLPLCAACGAGTTDPGLFADLRVNPGTYVAGPMPSASGGPDVIAVDLATNRARIGQVDKPLRGALGKSATAAVIGLTNDVGYWIVPAKLPDVQAPEFPTFEVMLSFSPEMQPGLRELIVHAADEAERLGVASLHEIEIQDVAIPNGKLVVSLRWDRNADLDLHVIDPNGVEIYKRNINSYEAPPPGEPVDPAAWQQGALLDFDSNAACVLDGRRRENVVWKNEPPSGHYVVRVDTFSLCGESFANWSINILKNGGSVASARGQSGPTDEMTVHDRGAGVLAVEFDWP